MVNFTSNTYKAMDKDLEQLFLKHPDILYGYADISYSSHAGKYRSALVFAAPYGRQLTLENYSEEEFERGIREAGKTVEEVLAQLEEVLCARNVEYCIPPAAQSDEDKLEAPFSFKYAAVNAGLGWIGKNDVLITEKYGPRVKLSAVLIDREFPYGRKISQSKCPEACKRCVEACPYHALHDVRWNINVLRNDIIDYKLCNQMRSLYVEKHGRKNACGLCMAACPIGAGHLPDTQAACAGVGSVI